MPEIILESVLNGQLDLELLLTWLRSDNLEGDGEDCLLRRCGRNEFTAYFLSFLRAETDSIVENDSGARAVIGTGTPERSDGRAHRRAASDPTADTPARIHHSPSRDKKRSGRKVKTKLFTDDRNKDPASPDDVRITTGVDRLTLTTSTPLKSDSIASSPKLDSSRSPAQTPSDRPRHRHEATLGDYLPTASRVKKKRNSRTSDDSIDTRVEATPNNNSARKSTSLRSEKRRIKPTNIDLSKKSISLSSFHSEFQKAGALALESNEAFSAPPITNREPFSSSPGFAAERDALRRERHRLLEKFSSLSAANSPKCTTPLIKISQEEDKYILPDVTKVTCEKTIEVLVKVYQVLLDCNLALSYTNELCFLFALLRGKQRIDVDTSGVEPRVALRSVHNAACFAARALRTQRCVLAALLDRPSLRALAEARVTKAMVPDLAKSLLDVYGVRGETAQVEPSSVSSAGHVVTWNSETDGADNFPSALSFHCFKKQRDMFYEIARWYDETGGGVNVGGASLRTRVRALLAAGAPGGQANYAHLGVLVARHALATVSGGGAGAGQESRLCKLQRRLTRPAAQHANTLFTPEEEFYRELLSCSENEPFRAAVRDALATELLALDSAPLSTGAALVSVSRCAATLAKLLGLLAALPYCPQHQPMTSRPLPYILALRSYAVPTVDVYSAVSAALWSGRLCVSVPWTVAYLCALSASDAAAPRLPPNTHLLTLVRAIYRRCVPQLPVRTALYLRCSLSALFAQANIPQELLYEEESDEEETLNYKPSGLDASDVITESELGALLGARKELAALLSEGAAGGGPRHVTPLRVGPSPNRATQRHTLIQKRLEEAVVRGCGGAGARRVLELVCERVAAAALAHTTRALAAHRHSNTAPCDVSDIRRQGASIRAQLQAALGALLSERGGGGGAALCALAERAVRARLARHTREPGELCDAANAALRSLVSSSWNEEAPPTPVTPTSALPTSPTVPTPQTMRDKASSAVPTSPTLQTKRDKVSPAAPTSPTLQTKRDKVSPAVPTSPTLQTKRDKASSAVPTSQTQRDKDLSIVPTSPTVLAPQTKRDNDSSKVPTPQTKRDNASPAVPTSPTVLTPQTNRVTDSSTVPCSPTISTKQDKDLATALIDLKECICLTVEQSTPDSAVLCSALEAVAVAGASRVRGAKRAALQLSLELGVALACSKPEALTEAVLLSAERVWAACVPHAPVPRPPPPVESPPERGAGDSRAPTPVSDDEGPPRPPPKIVIVAPVVNDKGPESDQEELTDTFARLVSPRVVRQVSPHGPASWRALARLVLWAADRGWLSPHRLTESCVALYRRDWPQEVLSPLSLWLRGVGDAISRVAGGEPQLALFLGFLGEYCDDLVMPTDDFVFE